MKYTSTSLECLRNSKYIHLIVITFGGFHLAEIINKQNDKGIRVFLCVIDIFRKHAWIIRLKNKSRITITNTFQRFSDESGHKTNKIRLAMGSEFYDR